MTRVSWPSVFRAKKTFESRRMVGFRGAFWSTQYLNRDRNQESWQCTGQEGEEDSQRSVQQERQGKMRATERSSVGLAF